MHSAYQRFNSITALLSSCLLALVGGITLSTYFFYNADPKGALNIASIKVYTGRNDHFRARDHEFSFAKFNVSADLTPLFNWNTKQLFLYVTADFTSADGTRNEVVVWDRIVRRKENAKINVEAKSKYVLRDMAKTFDHASPVRFAFKYNVMPYVGLLTYGEAARTEDAVPFPASQRRVS